MNSVHIQTFRGHSIHAVDGQCEEALRNEILHFWQDMVSPQDMQQRLSEVVLVVRNSSDELVGLTTGFLGVPLKPDLKFWYLRISFAPGARGVFRLPRRVATLTRDRLLARRHPQADGVAIVLENSKLRQPSIRRLLVNEGWKPLGKGPLGNEVWYVCADGSEIDVLPEGFTAMPEKGISK
ncbi:MAG: hypothetical protein GY726_02135 [Proteobacteria bacterium]|nr:hypothetical protein [Pseudomonadota bacterium]